MTYPEVKIVDYNDKKPNLQRWDKVKNEDNEWIGRIVSKVEIGKLPKGWKFIGVPEWQLRSHGKDYKGKVWTGNIKVNIIEVFDKGMSIKYGGRFRNINNLSVILGVVLAFKNEKGETVTGLWETEYTRPHPTTGKIQQGNTILKGIDNETPEPEVPDEPNPALDKFIVLSFYWKMLVIAFLQSMLFWKKFWKMPTHGDFGLSGSTKNLSATGKGVKFIERVVSKLMARKYKEIRIKLTPEEVKKTETFFAEHLGAKYNYYFYFRWALNTYILPSLMLGIYGLFTGHIWIDYVLITLYVPVNFILWILSRGKYACVQLMAKYLKEVLDIDLGYGKSFQDATPYDILRKFESYQNLKGREII